LFPIFIKSKENWKKRGKSDIRGKITNKITIPRFFSANGFIVKI
jgi:hypothetical protein